MFVFTYVYISLQLLILFGLQVGDKSGELTARLNLSDLQMVLGLSYSTNNSMMSESHVVDNNLHGMCFFPNAFSQ